MWSRFVGAALVAAVGCGDVIKNGPDGGDPPSPDPELPVPVAPVAPTVANPMYQGTQRLFTTQLGGTCKGRVAASMASTGFCYLAASDDVKCAGVIGGQNFGMTPTTIGQGPVEQIMVMFSDNGMCVTRTDHTVTCMGTNVNAFGTAPGAAFIRWTARDDIAAIASGTWDQICGITRAGQPICGGSGFMNPPSPQGAAGQTSIWVDTFGSLRASDTAVLRPGESRTECQVRANGLVCAGTAYGPTNGTVVSGTAVQSGTSREAACWLTTAGTVTCTFGPRFAPGKVLFLAAGYYTDSMCAIYNDGSVWCIGSNSNGKLGTGNAVALATETQVAPPGSALVRCE